MHGSEKYESLICKKLLTYILLSEPVLQVLYELFKNGTAFFPFFIKGGKEKKHN